MQEGGREECKKEEREECKKDGGGMLKELRKVMQEGTSERNAGKNEGKINIRRRE
jgi:hypothetical protein